MRAARGRQKGLDEAAGTPERRLLERLPLARGRPVIGYVAAALLIALAFVLRLVIPIDGSFYFVTFQPAVILTAFLFGVGPGVAALIAATLIGTYVFVPPAYSFAISPDRLLGIILFVLTGGLLIFLIHWMQHAYARLNEERRLSAALAENRELLFRELQHRVSNNLQVVAALLALQKKNIADEGARKALDEAARRLSLIGRIHRQLYEPSGARIGMAAFLRDLAADVVDSAGRPDVRLEVKADETLDLRSDAAIPVALIVAEAIANAVEHGFAGRDAGTVRITMARADGGAVVEIADNGGGLPSGFDAAHAESLGLRIANLLARQLGGEFSLGNGEGAVACLRLPRGAIT